MYKGVKKIKFRKGKDSTEATVRKLVVNFIGFGKVKTTVKRAKIIRQQIDILVHKAQEKTEASKNVILKRVGDKKILLKLTDEIGPHFNDRTSGFVKMVRTGTRVGDGAETAVVTWIKPFVVVEEVKGKEKKSDEKTKEINEKIADAKIV